MRKTAKKAPAKSEKSTPAVAPEFKSKPLEGKAPRAKEWDPTQPQAAAPGLEEINEPRPSIERYPISNEAFQRLKDAAAKAKLPRKDAEVSKDKPKKASLVEAPMAAVALEPGLAPVEAPAASTNFAGIPATGWIPPDCTLAAGPQHVLASVNSSIAVYNKTGGPAVLQQTLTVWFANVVQGLTIFDPKALYDQHAGRWVLLAVAVGSNPDRSFHLVSVSSTSNPLGPWRNYRFDATLNGSAPSGNWADFPALGVDNQALYVTSNMFQFNGNFQYAKIRIIPKAGPYSGGAAPYFDFFGMKNADNSVAFTIQPCHTFGAPQIEYLANTAFPSGKFITVWRITNPTGTPVLTRTQVDVAPYNLAPNADQSGGTPPLNTGDVRLLHAVFRGDSIWTAFTTAHNWGGASNRAAIQWAQIRAAVPALVQQGVYGAANFHYFYPAPCPDANGNMVLVFSRSGPSEFGSVLYTGRRSTDPLGSLQGSAVLKAGVAHYTSLDKGGRNRWGDYNGIASDPTNGRVIWFYGEFASAPNTWATWIGSSFF